MFLCFMIILLNTVKETCFDFFNTQTLIVILTLDHRYQRLFGRVKRMTLLQACLGPTKMAKYLRFGELAMCIVIAAHFSILFCCCCCCCCRYDDSVLKDANCDWKFATTVHDLDADAKALLIGQDDVRTKFFANCKSTRTHTTRR
jgi:hypothetical protein